MPNYLLRDKKNFFKKTSLIVEVEEVQLIKVNAILKAGPKGNRDVVSLRENKTYYFM